MLVQSLQKFKPSLKSFQTEIITRLKVGKARDESWVKTGFEPVSKLAYSIIVLVKPNCLTSIIEPIIENIKAVLNFYTTLAYNNLGDT